MSGHHHHHHHTGSTNIKVAFFLNLIFTIIELIGGILTNSVAVLSDALHDLGDSISLGLSWYLQRVSEKGRTTRYSYGYRRFSLLGAIINGMILFTGSIFIITEAIPRIQNPEPSHATGMMLLAVIGILFNGAAVWRLRTGSSQNEKVVSLHLLEDVLGWVAILIGGAVIHFTNWYIIDPILSLLIAAYILYNAISRLKESMGIILQAVPKGIELQAISERIQAVEGVVDIHDLHVWSMDGERNVLTVHTVLDDSTRRSHSEIKQEISTAMAEMDIGHCTIETELPGEDCGLQDCH